jgi:hypothetical protein
MANSDYGPAEWLMAFDWLFLRLDANGQVGREGVKLARLKNLKEVLSHDGRRASNKSVRKIATALAKAWEDGTLRTERRIGNQGRSYWAWKVRSKREVDLERARHSDRE